MCTSCSNLKAPTLVAAVALLILALASVSAQTGGQSRPRTLATTTEDLKSVAEETELVVGSPEANAEARKLYKEALRYGHAGLFNQAAELFERAVKLKPDYEDAYSGLGHAYFDMKQWDKAVPTLERVLELDPKNKDSRERLDLAKSMLERERREGTKSADPVTPQEPSSSPSTPTIAVTKVSADEASLTKVYRVGSGDVLEVRFNDTPANEQAVFTVTPAGLLEHPNLAEPLTVTGLTVDEIGARLESAAKRRAETGTAPVSVKVHDYVSHAIMVSGLVKEPGAKILQREAIPLSVVVADAQPLAEAEQVVVVRNETKQSFTIDLSQAADMSMLVRPGDVITLQVSPPQFFYVSGEVKAPGEKSFRRGLTLTQAIISAGGLIKKAKEVRLARDDGKGFLTVTRYKLQDIESGKVQDPAIQPGDRITIMR
jgi:protein involved in polysaccharide export with SLBB domain